ncbi:MAG: undecaprenyl-diphosphate phosphatase, partial [Lachnospiraceae bacterium]|nr:undecaprenyl-diphosphate phosphatase [Lachnospiraceae bacterium]
MNLLESIFLGFIQGITEFLPVSSFGHLIIFENFFQIKQQPGILYEMMLHTGTAISIIFVFRKDLKQ